MKRKLLFGIALLSLIITACNNPLFPMKKEKGLKSVDLKHEEPVINNDDSNLDDSNLFDAECVEGEELVLTVSVEGDEDDYTYQWYSNTENSSEGGTPVPGATNPSFSPPTDEEGTTYYYVVITNKKNEKTTSSKPVKVTVNPAGAFTIVVDISGNVSGDTVTASPGKGDEGNTVTLTYSVANTTHYNMLDFGGVTSAIPSVNSAENGTRTYTINAADASSGVITITAVFTHTNLQIDPIAFNNTGHINKTYGDAAFINAVVSGYSGSGAITYSSSDTTVATVNNSGQIIIRKAGSAVITAEKAADAVYAHAQTNYTLTVNPKPVTITGLSAVNKVYDGTTTATVTGTAVISGLINGDMVTVSAGTASFATATVGNGKTVTFSGWSLTGVNAGNYTLSVQPANVTANITAKSVTITGLSAGNKQYDGTTTATITGVAVISGLVIGDTVTVSAGIASFANSSVGNSKTVTFSGWSLSGADAGNYSLSAQPASVTANIELVSMVQISAGNFMMGQTDLATPIHSVTLSAFYMGKYEITQALYELVMGTNPSSFNSSPQAGETQGKHPVEDVTWYDAVEFCNKLSALDGRTAVYTITGRTPTTGYPITSATVTMDSSKNGYRLPTEAQWEYACRAGTTTAYNTGDTINDNTGWYSSNSGSKTHEVGKKPANAWGLYDMHGNVWEWCWDWYGTYPSTSQTDPLDASSGTHRVRRGGGWDSVPEYLCSAYRGSRLPGSGFHNIGFRLICP